MHPSRICFIRPSLVLLYQFEPSLQVPRFHEVVYPDIEVFSKRPGSWAQWSRKCPYIQLAVFRFSPTRDAAQGCWLKDWYT